METGIKVFAASYGLLSVENPDFFPTDTFTRYTLLFSFFFGNLHIHLLRCWFFALIVSALESIYLHYCLPNEFELDY